jgi:hypothetical protein
MKTFIKLLLALALIAISFTSCEQDEPTLDEKKQAETVVTPEMLYGTWVLTEMYSVYFVGEDSIVTSINYGTIPDTVVHFIICDTIKFIHYLTPNGYESNYSAKLTQYFDINGDHIKDLISRTINDDLNIIDNYIEWDYIEGRPNDMEAKIAIVNGKLVMNTEIIGNRYIFSVFTKLE